ncbi:MAG: ABC transporter substrate-binding protein [Acidimicrobiia bacterium]
MSTPCATSSVYSGVTPTPVQKANTQAPSGNEGDVHAERIVIRPPAHDDTSAGAYTHEPIQIGFFVDYEPGELLCDLLDPLILAFEDAMNCGRLTKAVELVTRVAVGLPTRAARYPVEEYHRLVDEGALLVIGPGVSDNSVALKEHVEARRVPTVGIVGSSQFHGEYCFTLPNGGHGEEAALVANYVAQQGWKRIALFGEHGGTGDIEYRSWFADQARMQGLHVVFEHLLERRPADGELDPILADVRDRVAPDALVYMGTGWTTPAFNAALDRIGWDPPRVCNAAFMWAPHDEAWMRALEGWTGVDQLTGPDGPDANPNYNALLDRFEARFGRRVDHVVIALMYDMGRVVAEAIVNAPMMNGHGMKLGLERIKMFPSAIGGARTNITFGAQDHRGYKGDFLVMRQLVNQRYVFKGGLQPHFRVGDAAGE